MRVVDRLSQREASWHELDRLVDRLSASHFRRLDPADVLRLGQLYRGVCSDLMLAESFDLPRDTVAYMHALVARGHNALYRSRGFELRDLAAVFFDHAPRALRADPALRLSAAVFVVSFLLCALLAAARRDFAREVVGDAFLEQV